MLPVDNSPPPWVGGLHIPTQVLGRGRVCNGLCLLHGTPSVGPFLIRGLIQVLVWSEEKRGTRGMRRGKKEEEEEAEEEL